MMINLVGSLFVLSLGLCGRAQHVPSAIDASKLPVLAASAPVSAIASQAQSIPVPAAPQVQAAQPAHVAQVAPATQAALTVPVAQAAPVPAAPAAQAAQVVPVAQVMPAAQAAPVVQATPTVSSAQAAQVVPAAQAAHAAQAAPEVQAAPAAPVPQTVQVVPAAQVMPVAQAAPVSASIARPPTVAQMAPAPLVPQAAPVVHTAPIVQAAPVVQPAYVPSAAQASPVIQAAPATTVAQAAPAVQAATVVQVPPASPAVQAAVAVQAAPVIPMAQAATAVQAAPAAPAAQASPIAHLAPAVQAGAVAERAQIVTSPAATSSAQAATKTTPILPAEAYLPISSWRPIHAIWSELTLLEQMIAGLTFASMIKAVCLLGNVLVQVSPFPQVKRWEKRQDTGETDAAPYVSIAYGGWQWCYYGFFAYFLTQRSGFLILVHSNCLGAVLGTYYTMAFYRHCKDNQARQGLQKYLCCVMTLIFIQVCAISTMPAERALFMTGLISSFCGFVGAISMLASLPTVIRTQDSRAIPGPLALANSFSALAWLICGYILSDPMITAPNVVCFFCSMLCLYLKQRYPCDESGDGDCEEAPAETQTAKSLQMDATKLLRKKVDSFRAEAFKKKAQESTPLREMQMDHCGTGGTF